MSAHTPGPWKFDASTWYGYCALWNPETRQEVLVTGGRNDGDDPITWMGEELSEADRLLIEAAPDLLESLKRILLDIEFMWEDGTLPNRRDDVIYQAARAAIAKATGAP